MSNIFVRIPKLGDYVCKRVSDRKVFYLDWTNPDCPEGNLFTVGEEQYEKIGSAVPYEGDKVLCLWRETASKTWCERYEFKLTGYVLDGAEHTGTLSIREASNNWAADVDYNFTYSASTLTGFVEQLNAYFAATEVFDGEHQDWFAKIEGEDVVLNYKASSIDQRNPYGRNGFALVVAHLAGSQIATNISLRNGYTGGSGMIYSWHRASKVNRADTSSTAFNPTADVTSVKRNFPICLPAYLGTSAYQSDHCAFLRSVYGEGEDGWLRFMASFLPTDNDRSGAMSGDWMTAKRDCAILAAKTYTSQAKTDEPMCKAARYCYDVESATVDKGEFVLPSLAMLVETYKSVRYPTPSSTRTADSINASRLNAGWPAIGNDIDIWTGILCTSALAWHARGSTGLFFSAAIHNNSITLPVTLFTL